VADLVCNNCGASLVGPFCHQCGQREIDEWRSIGAIVRQFWDELVSFDYKSARTVLALFRPGYLAAEFIAGRRDRYLSPLKVYFLTAALFFIVAPRVTDFTFERQMALDPDGRFRAMVAARLADTHMSPELFAERFNAKLQTIYTITPIFSVLSAALVLRQLFGRKFPWLGPHTAFALYHVAFMFFVWLLLHGLNQALAGIDTNILIGLLFAIVVPYMFVALRRVYGEPSSQTCWKTLAFLAVTFLLDAPINAGAMLLSVRLT